MGCTELYDTGQNSLSHWKARICLPMAVKKLQTHQLKPAEAEPTFRKVSLLASFPSLLCFLSLAVYKNGVEGLGTRPTIQNRSLYLKMCTLHYVVLNLIYFPSNVVLPKHNSVVPTLLLHQPFAWTNAFCLSFVPSAVSLWNNIPQNYVVDGVHAFVVDPPHDWSLLCKQAPAGEACEYHWLVGDQVYLTQQVLFGDDVMIGLLPLT